MLKSNSSTSCDTKTKSILQSFFILLSTSNSPFSKGYKPAKIFIVVVFPCPDSPTILILSPLFNTNSGILIFVESFVYEKITSYVENPLKDKENPVIYLYNTHQLETYSNSGFENSNVNPNVLMASYLLAESLNKSNINTIVEDTNINEFNRISGINDNDFYRGD